MPHSPGIGAIFGIVSEDGTPKENFSVDLYDRSTGEHISRQVSDANGGFTFNGLNPDTDDYRLVTGDEDNAPYKDAIARDRITPVPGYQGATYGGNWFSLALQYGARGIVDYKLAPDNKFVSPYHTPARPTMRGNGDTTEYTPTTAASLTPGAPHIPALDLQGYKFFSRLQSVSADNNGDSKAEEWTQNPAKASFEFVADFSTLSPQSGDEVYFGMYINTRDVIPETENNGVTRAIIACGYDDTVEELTVYRNDTGSGSNADGTWVALSPVIDMSSHQGTRHVVVTIQYGVECKVYINDTLEETYDLSGSQSEPINSGSYTGLEVMTFQVNSEYGSRAYNNNGANGKVGPMAAYPVLLTASEISDLYDALMVGSTPVLTGYVKDVMIDRPCMYVRLNESVGTLGEDTIVNQSRPVALFNGDSRGGIVFGGSSIVTGGNSADFDGTGGIRFNEDGGALTQPKGYTVEWIAKPSSATPGGVETIYAQTDTAETRTGVKVQRETSGKLTVIHTAASAETINFDTTMADTAAQHHFAIVVDKDAQTAKLYVDGVEVEEDSTNAVALTVQYDDIDKIGETMIGGLVADNLSVTEGFDGELAEVAFYNYPLAVARIASHYAERATV